MKYYLRYIDSADCFLLTDETKKPIEDSLNSFLLAMNPSPQQATGRDSLLSMLTTVCQKNYTHACHRLSLNSF